MPPIKPRKSRISPRLHLPQYQSLNYAQRCLFKQSYTLQWINECGDPLVIFTGGLFQEHSWDKPWRSQIIVAQT